MRAVLYSIFIISIGVIVATVMLGFKTRLMDTRASRPVSDSPPDGGFEIPPMPEFPEPLPRPAGPPPAPIVKDPRPARPSMDFKMRQKIDTERFNRVLKRFYPGELDPPDAQLRLVVEVASDGKVIEARTEGSTFGNAAFEAALLEEVRRTKYPEDDRYRATAYGFDFKSVKPLPRRPLAEIETGRGALLAGIEKRRQAIFATSPVPAGARLKVVYRVLPSGAVDDVKVESSSYRSTAFGRAVVDEVRKLRFAANSGYAPTEFVYEYAEGGRTRSDGRAP